MLGNFTYCNPTRLYFGKEAMQGLEKELPKYGENVLLVYGGGSIKKNGIYDQVVAALKACGKKVFEEDNNFLALRNISLNVEAKKLSVVWTKLRKEGGARVFAADVW